MESHGSLITVSYTHLDVYKRQPLYYDNIDITPDFSEARLEGDLFMKGRIRLGTIGWSVLKVIWNKNVKITIARLKKISGGN